MVDKRFCSSSYLMYRTISDPNKSFSDKYLPSLYKKRDDTTPIKDSYELEISLKQTVEEACTNSRTALALSGGMDSAVLAKFMPPGSIAYTFHCVVPGIEVVDEVPIAKMYAEACGLEHRVIDIYWEDFEKYADTLMKYKGAPIHSIEVQIYKAALKALEDGNKSIIFGESADLNYGGLSGLLSKNWTVGEFIDRYSYVKPYHVLRDYQMITEPIAKYEQNGYIDVHEFNRNFFLCEAMGSYTNACNCAGINLITPYERTSLSVPLNLERIRRGENKYLIRELYRRLYPKFEIPPKTPMPRPMNEWLSNWNGPKRKEFWENCIVNFSGDQKWLVWALEHFLNIIEED